MEWAPEQPRKLSGKEIAEYKRGRNKALAELAGVLGGPAVVFEL